MNVVDVVLSYFGVILFGVYFWYIFGIVFSVLWVLYGVYYVLPRIDGDII